MPSRIGLLALVLLMASGCSSSHRGAVTTSNPVRPPTLPTKASPNSVASFPCPRHPISTVDMESCAGRQQLKLNAQFNNAVFELWPALDATSRQAFANAQRAWSRYVRQECETESRAYLGGTAAGVAAGYCLTSLTRARVREVTATLALYCQGKVTSGRFRRCPRS